MYEIGNKEPTRFVLCELAVATRNSLLYFRDETADESSRLRMRIAELESVVRGLKKNPHPRWAASGVPTEDLCSMYRKRFRTPKEQNDESEEAKQPIASGSESGDDSCQLSPIDLSSALVSSASFDEGVVPRRAPPEAIFIPSTTQEPPSLSHMFYDSAITGGDNFQNFLLSGGLPDTAPIPDFFALSHSEPFPPYQADGWALNNM